MNKFFRSIMVCLLAIVMTVGSAPLAGFVGLELPDWLDFSKLFAVEAEAATYSGSCGDNLTWNLDVSTGELDISGIGTMTKWTSSSSVPWYNYRSSISFITIQDGVTSIGIYAFMGCTNLESVTIPNSVTSIGIRAFCDCVNLTNISIPTGVTVIDNLAFSSCTNLMNIIIPNGVTKIGSSAFKDCDGLKSVNIPDSVTIIDDYAFNDCDNLINVTIGNGVSNIGYEAFFSCDNLECVIIGDDLKTIGRGAFGDCHNLISVTIPDSVVNIGNYAFSYHTQIKGNKDSCAHKYALEKDYAYWLFDDESQAKTYSGKIGTNLMWSIDRETRELTINNEGTMVSFLSEPAPWLQYVKYIHSVRINYGCTNISRCAFKDCLYIKYVYIPNSVTSIDIDAFRDCDILSNITIPDSVTNIAADAFFKCDGLLNISIPGSVISIGVDAFCYCKNLLSVTIDNGVTSIEAGAFYNCTSLTNVTVPESVTNIGNHAFNGCTNLSSITIPDSVTSIGSSVFANCPNLSDVYIHSKTCSIKTDAITINATIHGYSGSTAETFANTYNYKFVQIVDNPCENHMYENDCDIYCDACGYKREITHTFSEWKIIKQPTCVLFGSKMYICSICGYSFVDEKVDSLGHDIVIDKAVASTCTATGLTEGQHCSRCDDETVAQEIIPALNHKDTLVKVTAQAPTCTEIGWDAYEYCTACTYTTYEEKAALKHDIVIDKAVEPTCTETGLTEGQHCSRCEDATVAQEIIPMIKHTAVTSKNDSTNHWGVCSCGEKLNLEGHKYGSDNVCDVCEYEKVITLKMSIRKPSTTTISYGDSIILHADMNEALPSGWTVKWTADNGNFSYSANGETCTITPSKSGDTTFTATVYDENGNEISKDTQTMKSKAGFFDKFAAFFRKLFGMTKIIQQSINF